MLFTDLPLSQPILRAVADLGYTTATPIQGQTLPHVLAGKDVVGCAQTGTGKTAAFALPALQRLSTSPRVKGSRGPRCLILCPTRELAGQIAESFRDYGKGLKLYSAVVFGGVSPFHQIRALQRGADVIIATPGRLIDYVKQHVVSLHACEVCILDEADRMFDLGFIKDLRFLMRRLPARTERQTLLFSATLSHRVLELAYEHMNEPEKLVVETETITAARVRQKIFFPANEEKIPLLLGLLSRSPGNRTMVFVNTKAMVERVGRALERGGYLVGVLSGDVPQKKRQSLLAKFQRRELEILVATDVAARGLHIDGVSHVYNFDLPFEAEDYVHRIGRTARLGAEGDAITFACELYAQHLPAVEAYIEQKIPVESVTADLLTALPRPERAALPEGAEPVERVSDIFREARAEMAEKDAKHGRGGRGGGGGRGGRGEGRGDRGPRPPRAEAGRGPRGDRPERGPRPERAPKADVEAAVQNSAQAPQGVAGAEAPADAERRRRRRRRKPRGERGEGQGPAAGSNTAGNASSAPGVSKESFFARMASRVKGWFGG